MMTGAHSAAKPADDDIRALFETDAGKAAVAAVLGAPVEALVVTSYTTQVVRAGGVRALKQPASATRLRRTSALPR